MPVELGRLIVPVVATLPSGSQGQLVCLSTDGRLYEHNGTNFVPAISVARRFERTWGVAGNVTPSITLPGPFMPVSSEESIHLVGVRYRIHGGTSQAFTVNINGAAASAGYTSLSATPTVASASPTAIAVTANDEFQLVLGAGVGTPTDLAVSLYFESVG